MAQYPRPKSAILPLAHLAQDQARLAVDRGDGRDRRAHRRDAGRACRGRAPSTRCSSAARAAGCSCRCARTSRASSPVARRSSSTSSRRTRSTPRSTVEEVECLAACGGAPAMQVNYEFHEKLTPSVGGGDRRGVQARRPHGAHDLRHDRREPHDRTSGPFEETRIVTKRLHERPDDSWTIDGALATGCYDVLRDVLAQGRPGRDPGAGRSSGPARPRRRELPERPEVVVPARRASFPRYLVVNGDEGEPSTFKDRMLVERDPHQLIEGIVIAAYAIQCNLAFIYLRGEFALGYDRLDAGDRRRAAPRASSARTSSARASTSSIVVHRGAGAYICGEETALLESLEGERGMPRLKPPFPAIEGLYAKPTVVNNVETLSTVPHIVQMGGEEYAKLGVGPLDRHAHRRDLGSREAARQLRGRVRLHVPRPHLRARGRHPRRQRAQVLPARRRVVPVAASAATSTSTRRYDMDFVQQNLGTTLGSGAIMVFDETTDPLLVAWRLAKFYAHESCGKCTPCREGTGWIEKVLYRMAQRPRPARGPRPAARHRRRHLARTSRPRRSRRRRCARSARASCRRSRASTSTSATRSTQRLASRAEVPRDDDRPNPSRRRTVTVTDRRRRRSRRSRASCSSRSRRSTASTSRASAGTSA